MREARRMVRAAAEDEADSEEAAVRARPRVRLVATDLDGTLLAPDGTLSARTLAVARRLREAGITLALATARRWTGAAPIAEALELRGPLILYDGAIVREYPSGADLLRNPLLRSTARSAVELLAQHHFRPIVQYSRGAGELLFTGPAPTPGPDASASYLAEFAAHVHVVPIEELVGTASEDGAPGEVMRVVAFGSERRLRQVARELAQLPCGRQLLKGTAYASGELTLFSATASKGSALAAMAERLGIPLAQTLAIGDGVNDIALLKIAGTSVAMGNATPAVRRVARHLTATHAEDGWATAIETHVLPRG